jgi:hypothetical protein
MRKSWLSGGRTLGWIIHCYPLRVTEAQRACRYLGIRPTYNDTTFKRHEQVNLH